MAGTIEKQKWSVNQVIAYRLREARGSLKQTEAAKELEPFLGKLWTQTNFSAAERTVRGERERDFKASDVLVFAVAFGKPISYFLTPPEGKTVVLGTVELDLLNPNVRLPLLGPPRQLDETLDRLEELLNLVPAETRDQTEWQGADPFPDKLDVARRARYAKSVTERRRELALAHVNTLLRAQPAFDDPDEFETQLRELLGFFSDIVGDDVDSFLEEARSLRPSIPEEKGTA